MIDIERTIHNFKTSLCPKVDVASLHARSDIAHKWKLTYRIIVLREGIGWRLLDILSQAYKLGQKNMIIGARILTRAAIETLCLLIYMNKQMKSVINNKLSFNDFDMITTRMLLGSKKQDKMPDPINVNGLVKNSNQKYTGIKAIYDDLSETAHPNYDGICYGYSKLNKDEYTTEFGIFWKEKFGNQHETAIRLCLEIFENEYYNVWPMQYKQLEKWLEKNDNKLKQ